MTSLLLTGLVPSSLSAVRMDSVPPRNWIDFRAHAPFHVSHLGLAFLFFFFFLQQILSSSLSEDLG